MEATPRLTQFSHGSGCGCKVAPAVLEEILSGSSEETHLIGRAAELRRHLLVGNETKDDAAVYDMGDGTALISTVDFFMPIVDDPYTFGAIAAANALSDVYAMGGTPFLAIAVFGWPVEKLPASAAQQVIRGGKEVCAKAGVVLAGGHTIDSPEPFFGLSVNGRAPLHHIRKNSTAQQGDLLYLTKPLGTGMLTTALKRGLLHQDLIADAVESMMTLNVFGAELGKHDFVNALTDVTGFALIGHLLEMCEPANLGAEIIYSQVPLLTGVKDLAAKFVYADNTMRNWKSFEGKVSGISGESLLTLCDPQTSGGLLVSVATTGEKEFLALARQHQVPVWPIGRITAPAEKPITII